MRTHDSERLDEQQRDGVKKSRKSPEQGGVAESMRDLQATAGNRAVSDLVGKAGPTLQGRFFGGGFGGIEEWMAKESPAAASSFDPTVKQETSDASMKEEQSDQSMKVGSDKWDGSENGDASYKFDDKGDASYKLDEKGDASDKADGSEKVDTADKWDASDKSDEMTSKEEGDFSDKWDASEKTQPEFASKDDELTSKFDELELREGSVATRFRTP